ncbi:MAG: hypothetical protein J1E34_00500 [Oscillospiraceae bacterium]|nr:hypothetical protein [Oscillospiraceae bacterium]
MELSELMKKPLPQMPAEISKALRENKITGTSFGAKNDILSDENLQKDIGYKKLADGSYLVSMICPMQGITPEMIEWWFWWHPQADERYRVWFPNEHYGISYSKKNLDYFSQDDYSEFRNNTHYPTERIGKIKMPLRIDFVAPEEFGFSKNIMDKNDIPLIVCGHVGAIKGLVWHTEMAHIFKKTDAGLLLISRFWIGKTLKNPLLRKLILTEKTAKGMAEHCCIEYRNLAEILPVLYSQEKTGRQHVKQHFPQSEALLHYEEQ